MPRAGDVLVSQLAALDGDLEVRSPTRDSSAHLAHY